MGPLFCEKSRPRCVSTPAGSVSVFSSNISAKQALARPRELAMKSIRYDVMGPLFCEKSRPRSVAVCPQGLCAFFHQITHPQGLCALAMRTRKMSVLHDFSSSGLVKHASPRPRELAIKIIITWLCKSGFFEKQDLTFHQRARTGPVRVFSSNHTSAHAHPSQRALT